MQDRKQMSLIRDTLRSVQSDVFHCRENIHFLLSLNLLDNIEGDTKQSTSFCTVPENVKVFPYLGCIYKSKFNLWTRMHSSRMRTGRSLTVWGGVGENLETPKNLETPLKNWRSPRKIGDPPKKLDTRPKNWRPP